MRYIKCLVAAAGLVIVSASLAQAPAGAPAGSTGLCNDGTYYSGATKKGACRGHKGVKDWYGAASSAASAAPATTTTPAATVAPAPASTASGAASTKAKFTPAATAAPGGGPGMVWVNTSSKTYHCSTDKWYGKTKQGQYMSEADAKAKGFHPDHGKACN